MTGIVSRNLTNVRNQNTGNTSMNLNAYMRWTRKTVRYPHGTQQAALSYLGLGLCGEAGEVAEKLKKYIRDGHLDPAQLEKELGDALYYLVRICDTMNILPSRVIDTNREKLESRLERGVIHGNGDNR